MKASTPVVIMALILTVSCATVPSKTSGAASLAATSTSDPAPGTSAVKTPSSVPSWTTKTTHIEGSTIVFVLTGSEKADEGALALQSMTEFLNLPVKPTTTAAASQAAQKFLKKMSATAPSDHFVRDGKGWWKVIVGRGDWDNSRTQLAALFQEAPADPLTEMERTGDDLVTQGHYFEAVNQYVNAASFAVAEGAAPRAERFQSILGKAQAVLSQFSLTTTTPPQNTKSGQPFDSAFAVKLNYGAGAQAPSVSGALLRFSYKTKVNGHLVMTGQSVKTGTLGEASVTLPVPDFGAKDNVVVMIDVNPWLEVLAKVPANLRVPVSKLEPLMADRKLLLPYSVESASKQIPLIVALADFDEKGSVRHQETTVALIAALKDAGFQASGLSINLSLLKSASENVVLTAWRFQGKTTGRAVYGTASLVSVVAADSQFSAEVSGTLKVVDLATNKPVYQYKNSKIATGADKASAVTQGFRQWALDAAAAMTSELP